MFDDTKEKPPEMPRREEGRESTFWGKWQTKGVKCAVLGRNTKGGLQDFYSLTGLRVELKCKPLIFYQFRQRLFHPLQREEILFQRNGERHGRI